jgi:hypothetical protein
MQNKPVIVFELANEVFVYLSPFQGPYLDIKVILKTEQKQMRLPAYFNRICYPADISLCDLQAIFLFIYLPIVKYHVDFDEVDIFKEEADDHKKSFASSSTFFQELQSGHYPTLNFISKNDDDVNKFTFDINEKYRLIYIFEESCFWRLKVYCFENRNIVVDLPNYLTMILFPHPNAITNVTAFFENVIIRSHCLIEEFLGS